PGRTGTVTTCVLSWALAGLASSANRRTIPAPAASRAHESDAPTRSTWLVDLRLLHVSKGGTRRVKAPKRPAIPIRKLLRNNKSVCIAPPIPAQPSCGPTRPSLPLRKSLACPLHRAKISLASATGHEADVPGQT